MGKRAMIGVWFAAYVATVYGANWAIATYGIVPIGFGFMAPAGVFFAGLAFSLRDALQEAGGKRFVIAAILVGAAVSFWLGAAVAVASAAAFLLSEALDFAVYTPLRGHNLPLAVLLSNTVGAATDSAVFLLLAFGSLDFFAGQLVGKLYMTLPVVLMLALWRGAAFRNRNANA